MKVGLFIPCFVDQFYPQVGMATLGLLERLGCVVHFPTDQTCCGQPMANSGMAVLGSGCDRNFISNFAGCDHIVAPSGSCVLHLKEHLRDERNPEEALRIRSNIFELTEYLTDILQVSSLDASFPHKVGFHASCHGQRGLHLSSMSERVLPSFSKPGQLLAMVSGLEICQPVRTDECCGFGGTFSVFEEAVSVRMGKDRIREHDDNGVEYITGVDTSCLMHMEGLLRRAGSRMRTIHIAEILNSRS